MTSASTVKRRMGEYAGIAAPILAFSCILVAITSYPSFSWTDNALSDLGVIPGITGPLFNFGLCASGFLGFTFAIFGLFRYVGKRLIGKIGSVVFAGGTVALIAIGIFNESFSEVHYAVSVTFFVLIPVAMFIITYAFAIRHDKLMAAFTVFMGIFAAFPWIFQFAIHYVPNVAIPETISGIAVSIWIIAISFDIIRKTKN